MKPSERIKKIKDSLIVPDTSNSLEEWIFNANKSINAILQYLDGEWEKNGQICICNHGNYLIEVNPTCPLHGDKSEGKK